MLDFIRKDIVGFLSLILTVVSLIVGVSYRDNPILYGFATAIVVMLTVSLMLWFYLNIDRVANVFRRIRRIKGISAFYARRTDFKGWDKLYDRRTPPREVVFMGQTMLGAFEKPSQLKTFAEWRNAGTDFKILLLSPTTVYSQQLRTVGEGMAKTVTPGADPRMQLRDKIENTVKIIEEGLFSQIKKDGRMPHLRFSKVDMPFSVVMIDGRMVVTLYMTEAEADKLPTFSIVGRDTKAFASVMTEFRNIWENYSSVSPHSDPVMNTNIKSWSKYIDLKRSYYRHETLKIPPRQAIVFPTYRCSNSCMTCMFKAMNGKNENMTADRFKEIVDQLIAYGIEHIELSGGGEPMEAPQFDKMMGYLKTVRAANPGVKFGLLTNGLLIRQSLKKHDLPYIFNDYIRVSRLSRDEIENKSKFEELEKKWKEGVELLLKRKKDNLSKYPTRIGLKYLLTENNMEGFVEMVTGDVGLISQCDHIRFRSARNVDPAQIIGIEQEIYTALRNDPRVRSEFDKKIALSLPNIKFPNHFKCWISPMHVVVAPRGDVYICCNYSVNNSNAQIGNVFKDGKTFREIWESPFHLKRRHELDSTICTCREMCTNCRFAEVQFHYEQIISSLGYDFTTT